MSIIGKYVETTALDSERKTLISGYVLDKYRGLAVEKADTPVGIGVMPLDTYFPVDFYIIKTNYGEIRDVQCCCVVSVKD